jgi:hypothetical protein
LKIHEFPRFNNLSGAIGIGSCMALVSVGLCGNGMRVMRILSLEKDVDEPWLELDPFFFA